MKKLLFVPSLLATMACTNPAQPELQGRVEVYDFDTFRLHVYYTNDAMGDASYIIEGKEAVVTLEEPLFRVNVDEFNSLLQATKKPVAGRIADYHLGGTGSAPLLMAEGMPAFVQVPPYSAMMEGFQQAFGEAMVELPTGPATEVAFGSEQTCAGVDFAFSHGAASDFPGAAILIGGQVYFTHWAPQQSHANALQIGNVAAIDARIEEAEAALASGAGLFIGGHGGAAGREVMEAWLGYLQGMKEVAAASGDAAAFVQAMKDRFPGKEGEEGLEQLAAALYPAEQAAQ